MKLLDHIDLGLILILVSYSYGQGWDVTVPRYINATLGKDVTIRCNFTYPPHLYTDNIGVYWKKPQPSPITFNDNDKNAFIFHPNNTFVLKKYSGKTKLIGNKDKGDCSLKIQNITGSEPNIYVRIQAKGDQYSFKRKFVSIFVGGPGIKDVTLKPDFTNTPLPTTETSTTIETSTMDITQTTSATTYTAIFVPVSALLIIISVIGIVFWIKHRRSRSFSQQDSGHYANFSRATSNQAKRDAPGKKQDNQKSPEPKAIDEPVYVNLESPPDQMDQSTDLAQNIYANVDYYSK